MIEQLVALCDRNIFRISGMDDAAVYDLADDRVGACLPLSCGSRLSRTIDIPPMSVRAAGCGVLCARNLPGVLFVGPALSARESGWPTLTRQADYHFYENRPFGCLGLQDLRYEYVLTDAFVPGKTLFGTGAARAVRAELERVLC